MSIWRGETKLSMLATVTRFEVTLGLYVQLGLMQYAGWSTWCKSAKIAISRINGKFNRDRD